MYEKCFNAYREFWQKATDFCGTTTRYDWWLVQLANIVISIFTIPIFLRTFGFNIYGIICIIPQTAMDIRRLRDYGKNWKWIFINLIPIIGWIVWFIWLGFGKSGNGNQNLFENS